jgi:putative ABC transport system permease protein
VELKIALRNVFRNRRRTAFSLTVIVIGTVVFLFLLGFLGETLRSTERSLACETGAVQVADLRLFENRSAGYEYLIPPDVREQVATLVSEMPGVIGVTWQLGFAGLVGDEQGSTLIVGRGVVPCNCVNEYECIVTSGEALPEDASRQAILGRRLARKLDVAVGDRVNIATGTVSGTFNAATVSVIGEFAYSPETVEEQLGLFPLGFVQRLLKTDGVERILIGLTDLRAAGGFAAELSSRLEAAGIPLAARTWKDLSPSYESLSTFYTAFSGLAGVAVFALVFFSVIEVLTLAFLERTREVGTIRAFGATRWRVFRTFLLEGAFIGAMGGALGVLFGVAVALGFNATGVAWTPPGAAVPQPIRLEISLATTLIPFVTALAATWASALYPAWKNARLRIVQSLQSV